MVAQPSPSPSPRHMSVDEWRELERTSHDIKHEYIDGQVYALSGGSLGHERIALNVCSALESALVAAGKPCFVYNSDAAARLSSRRYTYPAASVTCDERDQPTPDKTEIQSPCVIVEVLSASIEPYDRGEKFGYYRSCPYVQEYVLSTDVLSEGQNLQDCGVLINYDLHWNPTRMVQRARRIDRIGTSFETLWVMNMFPDDGLEKLLGLVESLSQKIAAIDRSGLLDTSVLGEVVHPQNFNTLRRIEEEDGKVVEEQEQFVELVSSEFLLQSLKGLLGADMRQQLEDLPDGIHSGLMRQGAKGVFFYFTAQEQRRGREPAIGKKHHYWRYIDLSADWRGGHIEDNRYVITNLIQCQPDTPRVVSMGDEVDIFALQDR